ncbi:MAG: alpha/beta hydrolase [Myxococcota bacterium]
MRIAVALLLLLLALPAIAETRMLEDVAYSGAGDAAPTLDLFLPEEPGGPLLVFVHSRFWSDGERGRDLALRFARPLQRLGAAVAIVRHRPAPEHPHPAGAEDVAAAVAFLIDQADTYGYDPQKLFLAGHGSGGHLAALVTLDPRYLDAHGFTSRGIQGVVVWSGSFDLTSDAVGEELRAVYANAFGGRRELRDASPARHLEGVNEDTPTFLLLVAQHDLPGADADASAFAEALREAGHPAAEMFYVSGRDHWSALALVDPKGPARQHLMSLLELPGAANSLEDAFGTRRFWRDPSYTTLPFWEDEAHATRHDADERFLFTLNMPFVRPGRPTLLVPETYHALDLLAFVERNVPGGDRPWSWLTVTNVRGEKVVWRRSDIEGLRPQIVIGVDDERQLFRLTDVYHTKKRYSWKGEEEIYVLARPLGAFIHFQEPPPPSVDPMLFGRFGLQKDAFEVGNTDPLAPLRDLPEAEERILTETLRCVSCHRFRGVGAKAGHLRARDGQLVGGFGLALEDYPSKVWRRYCFEQVELADEIGATPVPLGKDAVVLYELVERERRR